MTVKPPDFPRILVVRNITWERIEGPSNWNTLTKSHGSEAITVEASFDDGTKGWYAGMQLTSPGCVDVVYAVGPFRTEELAGAQVDLMWPEEYERLLVALGGSPGQRGCDCVEKGKPN